MIAAEFARFLGIPVTRQANITTLAAAIWQRLADDYGTTVAYPTLRTYVTSRRVKLR